MSQENVEAVRAGYAHFNRTGEPDWNLQDPELAHRAVFSDKREALEALGLSE